MSRKKSITVEIPNQKRAMRINLPDYAAIAKQHKIEVRFKEPFIHTIQQPPDDYVQIVISCIPAAFPELLKKIMPVLKANDLAFRLIKDQDCHNRLDASRYGSRETACALVIFEEPGMELRRTLEMWAELCAGYVGMAVPNAISISQTVYFRSRLSASRIKALGLSRLMKRSTPNVTLPLLRRLIVPFDEIQESHKGRMVKAVQISRLTPCVVYIGNPFAQSDYSGRDVRDRLRWQGEVMQHLAGLKAAPRFIRYFEVGDRPYLVMEMVEGPSLREYFKVHLAGREWNAVPVTSQLEIVNTLIKVVKAVAAIHGRGIVHRDLTDANVRLEKKNNTVRLLDYEMAFYLLEGKPTPPFVYGSDVFAAPEQLHYKPPTEKEDVHSLGVILAIGFTGKKPAEAMKAVQHGMLEVIKRGSPMHKLITSMTAMTPGARPALAQVLEVLNQFVDTIKKN